MTENYYKLVSYNPEDRSNLRMMGLDFPVEIHEIRKFTVVQIKGNSFSQNEMAQATLFLKSVFGEDTLILNYSDDIKFFVAEPMTEDEMVTWSMAKQLVKQELLQKLEKEISCQEKSET
jgi:hypothetical protein